jgi:plasmid maintenance system antidote protein VapI
LPLFEEIATMAHPIDKLPAIHPGSFLKEELEALGTSARKFSEHIHVPHKIVSPEVV